MKNYFFGPVAYPLVEQMRQAADDGYLFRQKTGKLATVRFPEYSLAYKGRSSPNILLFFDQVELFKELLVSAPPSAVQVKDIDYMLGAGELFTLIVYGQLILENASIYKTDVDVLEQIFSFLVKDYSRYALDMVLGYNNSAEQEKFYNKMIKKPVTDDEGFQRVWQKVYAHRDQYTMNM